jgi:hypothetical protein
MFQNKTCNPAIFFLPFSVTASTPVIHESKVQQWIGFASSPKSDAGLWQ